MELTFGQMAKGYLPYEVDQQLLLPPDLRSWLPEEHLAYFVLEVVAELDLSDFYAVHDAKDTRGRRTSGVPDHGARPQLAEAVSLRTGPDSKSALTSQVASAAPREGGPETSARYKPGAGPERAVPPSSRGVGPRWIHSSGAGRRVPPR